MGLFNILFHCFIMPIIIDNTPDVAGSTTGTQSDILSKNALTTAGVLVGAGTGVAGAGILFMALPGQMTAAAALTGGLLYAGHRQSLGKSIIPGRGTDDKPSATTVDVTPVSEPDATAAAAA